MSQSNHFNGRDGQGPSRLSRFIDENPKPVFAVMVVVLAVSALVMTLVAVLEKPYTRDTPVSRAATPVDGVSRGFSRMWSDAAAISEALRIEREIIHLMDKDTLTAADSVLLAEALGQLETIRKKLNPTEQ